MGRRAAWLIGAMLASLGATALGARSADPKLVRAEIFESSIELEFDQPMRTWDGSGASLPMLRFEPALACRWRWDDDTRLICEADAGLRPATPYTVHVEPGLWSQAGRALAPVSMAPDVRGPEIVANPSWSEGGLPHFLVRADAGADPDEVQRHLVLSDDSGQRLAFRWEPLFGRSSRSDAMARLVPESVPSEAQALVLGALPGLASREGPITGTQDEELLRVAVNEGFRLRETGCTRFDHHRAQGWPVTCAPGDTLALSFSKPLSDASLQALSDIAPEALGPARQRVPTHRWPWRHGGVAHLPSTLVHMEVRAAGTMLELSLPPGLTAADGSVLDGQPTVRLDVADHAPQLRADPAFMLLAPGDARLPRVAGVNVPAGGALGVLSLGEDAHVRSLGLPSGRTNEEVAVEVPRFEPDVREQGGLVEARIGRMPAFTVAYAAWQVVASVDGDGLLAWVTRWEDGAPLAGAEVSLLALAPDAAGRIQARPGVVARTDAHGLARLPMPEDFREDAYRVLAVHQGQRSVLPLGRMIEGGRHPPYRVGPELPRLWGVTDQPLYRAGATVRYRLWARQRIGNRLRAVVSDGVPQLGLFDDDFGYGRIVRELDPPAHGADPLQGSVVLPATLPDGRYCIRALPPAGFDRWWRPDQGQGACFEVTRFDNAEIWATAEVAEGASLVGPGHALALDVAAGFYSGGPAVGADIQALGYVQALPLGEAYPEFAGFRFGDGSDQPVQRMFLRDLAHSEAARSDADGRAVVHVELLPEGGEADDEQPQPPAFGRLRLNVDVALPGVGGTASPAVEQLYARYPHFLGLRLVQARLAAGEVPRLEAVQVAAEGRSSGVDGAPVDVTVLRLAHWSEPANTAPREIGRCRIALRAPGECPVQLEAGHLYRFEAASPGAHATAVETWLGLPDRPARGAVVLERLDDAATGAATVRLVHPYARASVLLTLEHNGLLWHQATHIDGPEGELAVPLEPDWAPGATLTALVLDTGADGRAPRAEDAPPSALRGTLDLEIARGPAAAALDIDLPVEAAPGSAIVLRLHNPRATPIDATLAVVDDGLVVRLPAESRAALDPDHEAWLGSLAQWGFRRWQGFVGAWRPGRAWLPRLDPAMRPTDPPVVFDDPAPFAFDRAAGAAPSGGDGQTLDRIEVTGSRIDPADLFMPGAGRDPDLEGGTERHEGPLRARLRTRFLDSAHWAPDLVIGPGETLEVLVTLPDNLTRWRVFAWAADGDDGFSLSEATLRASLPVEARIAAPRRLFVDDIAELRMSARQLSPDARRIELSGTAQGPGIDGHGSLSGHRRPGELLSLPLKVHAAEPGVLDLQAEARADAERDAVARPLPIASRQATGRHTQVGWIEGQALRLPLPAGAPAAPRLEIEAGGIAALRVPTWLRELRDYPHLCWEQRLARALGAAHWLAAGGHQDLDWPDAEAVIAGVLDDAPGFLADDGLFVFFAPDDGWIADNGNPELSAYSLQALRTLQAMGHPVPPSLLSRLELALVEALDDIEGELGDALEEGGQIDAWRIERMAVVASAVGPDAVDADVLRGLHAQWPKLGWHARSQLVEALAAQPETARLARQRLRDLRAAGTARGLRRVLHEGISGWRLLGSAERDQCSLVATLARHDRSRAGDAAARALLRGLVDLHAGDGPSDTQAAAVCLGVVQGPAARLLAGESGQRLRIGNGAETHEVAADERGRLQWRTDAAAATLTLARAGRGRAPLAYLATVSGEEDLADAAPIAVGMALAREYAVLRGGQWLAIEGQTLREGDWVRVSLVLDAPGERHFLALTDPVPGAWRPENLALSGIAGPDLQAMADPGSVWLDTRQLGDTEVRLYAEWLPPGRHEAHYYARVHHAGRYLAPGATAELMYGRASQARTEAAVLEVQSAE